MLQTRIWPGLVALAAAICITAASAQAAPTPTAPSVSTGSATPLTPKSATITGTVTSDGAPTTYSFEYGTTTSYGSQTGTRNAGAGATNISISVNLSGLSPGTLYHYALVATNSVGTTTGSDQTFTTLSPPAPTVSTGAATSVTGETATLGGTVDPNGGPTAFYFQYGATSSYGAQTSTRNAGGGSADVSVSAQLFGLSAGTIYHYRVVATNSTGTTDGSDQTFTTTAAPPPVVVTGSATGATEKTATLAGMVTPGGAATTWDFEYGTTTSYGSQTASRYAGAGLAAVPVSAHISGLTAGQTYHFRLVATSSSGTTNGDDQTFAAAAAPAPTVVTGAASAIGTKSATLAGTVTANGAPTTFSFEYGTTTSYGSQTPTRNAGGGSNPVNVTATPSGLTPGTLYHYRLTATSSSGTTDGSDQTFTTTAATTHPLATHHFAGSVASVGSDSVTLGVLWTGPNDTALTGTTATVSVTPSTQIVSGSTSSAVALSSLQSGDLVGVVATGTGTNLSAQKITVFCDCHWVGGLITSINASSIVVGVKKTGPYDTVLANTEVTIKVAADTTYIDGAAKTPIEFSSLKVGDAVGVVFSAGGFFKAPGFNPATANFTAKQVHRWANQQVPDVSSDASTAASTPAP